MVKFHDVSPQWWVREGEGWNNKVQKEKVPDFILQKGDSSCRAWLFSGREFHHIGA